jgi:hypothetical protein
LRAAHVFATFTDIAAVAVLVAGPTNPFAFWLLRLARRHFRLSLWLLRLSLNLPMPALVPMAAGFRTDKRESNDTYGNSDGDTSAASRLRIVDRNNRQAHGDRQDDKRFCSLMEHELTPPRASEYVKTWAN